MRNIATKNYANLRSKLLHKGTTLRAWALKNSIPVGTVYNSVNGSRNGVRAHKVRQQLEEYLNEK